MPNRHQATDSLNTKEAIVLAALRVAPRPRTAYELINELRDEGITAPPTVYRALNRLITLGHAHRLESLNAYIACRSGHCASRSNVAFAICDDCGLVEEIEEPVAIAGIEAWAEGSRFAVGSITFELHGTCRSCCEDRAGNGQRR